MKRIQCVVLYFHFLKKVYFIMFRLVHFAFYLACRMEKDKSVFFLLLRLKAA